MSKEKSTVEPQVEQEAQQEVAEQKPILVIGTTQAKVRSYLKGYCTKNKIEAVLMNEDELTAYIAHKDPKYKQGVQFRSLQAFVGSEENRKNATEQALKLFAIMTKGANVEDAEKFTFDRVQCVHSTTLSHKQFNNIFDVWKLFGLVKVLDPKKLEFQFCFNKKQQREGIDKQVKSLMCAMISDMERYLSSIDADDTLTDEEKVKMKEDYKNSIISEL